MAIQWCVSTLGEPEWGMDEFLNLCAEFNIQGLELRLLNGSLDIATEMNAYLDNPEKTKKLLESGIHFPVIGSSLEIAKAGEKEFEEFKKSARVADRLRTRWLRVFDGPVWGEHIGAAEGENGRKIVARWKEWSGEQNIQARMAQETHGASSSSAVLERFLQAVGEPLDIIWDVHHTLLVAGESLEETWQRLGKRIVHVHVKDSIATASARHGYTLTLPGQGRLDGKEFMAFLEKVGYEGYVSLEWEKKWHPYLPPLKEALEALETAGWRQ